MRKRRLTEILDATFFTIARLVDQITPAFFTCLKPTCLDAFTRDERKNKRSHTSEKRLQTMKYENNARKKLIAK